MNIDIDICPNSFVDNHFCDLYGEYCTEIEDCDYKQRKKLEQENKKLKEKFKQITLLLPQHTKNIKEAKMLLNFDKLVADCARYKIALKEIDKKLEKALDAEQSDMEESFDLLYEIQDILTEVREEE